MPEVETKLEEAKSVIDRINSKWPQFEMDGTRNVWIVKPGAKSRGRGKASVVCDSPKRIGCLITMSVFFSFQLKEMPLKTLY